MRKTKGSRRHDSIRSQKRRANSPQSITFLGAAGNVSGSRFLVETQSMRLLVDCGLYQERRFARRNWDPFPISPDTIDAVILTHAHLDHCGYLPKLVNDGFHGKIYCTSATADLVKIILQDSAHIQEEDARKKKRRHEREGRQGRFPEMPLYDAEQARAVFQFLNPVAYYERFALPGGASAVLRDAGHILGASTVELTVGTKGEKRTILFSGDLGRWNRPLVRDPDLVHHADYVVVESTYGDRYHPDNSVGELETQLAEVINSTLELGGNIIIPSFAVERAQELLYHLKRLMEDHKIPRIPVFLDSPMAQSVTRVFAANSKILDNKIEHSFSIGESPLDFDGLVMVQSVDQSKSLNSLTEPAIIIAGAGMCNGGRIKHHLANNIRRKENTVLFVGYQAEGTLGRQIVIGQNPVRIFGQMWDVRARIVQIESFSAHADRSDLERWLEALEAPPRAVFVVHGESEASEIFSTEMSEKTGWRFEVPKYRDWYPLS
jgi:metallo-beta-lactamase family protein